MIPVNKSDVTKSEFAELYEALSNCHLGSGKRAKMFERYFGKTFGYENVVTTASGTDALDLAIEVVEPEGEEILVPGVTWPSPALAAEYNDYDVGWVDVEPGTLNMAPDALADRISDRTAAVVPVHYGGQPADVAAIVDVAREHDAEVIEDCAHAPGATYDGRPVGTFGTVGCFSFQATKVVTTGEGGAIVTGDDELAARVDRLTRLGLRNSVHGEEDDSWRYEIPDVGYKSVMSDLQASVGLAQVSRYSEMVQRRREIAAKYDDAFSDVEWLTPLDDRGASSHARYNYSVKVPADDRDRFVEHLHGEGVGAAVQYVPPYEHEVFADHDPDLDVTESVWPRLATLPMSSSLTDAEVSAVVSAVTSFNPGT